ncbi:hypothetical protein NPIL_645171, partial [Nephila pilipes]
MRYLFSLIGRTVNFGPLGPGFETTLPHQGQQLLPLLE